MLDRMVQMRSIDKLAVLYLSVLAITLVGMLAGGVLVGLMELAK